jgi:hypothetical protein
VIYAFIAGAAIMCVLCLGMATGLTILLARVNGSVARVLSESVREALAGIFQPPPTEVPEAQGSVEQDEELPTHGPQGLWFQDEPVPSWETEDMEPLEIRP